MSSFTASKSGYFVIGWKGDPETGLVKIFESRRSFNPRPDVERALQHQASLIEVNSEEDIDEWKKEFIKGYLAVGARDREGRYYDPPLRNGVLTYSVSGFAPTGKIHPIDGKPLHRVLFKSEEESIDPASDVEKALKMGCTIVSISANYELTHGDKIARERFKRAEEEDQKFWDNIPEFSAEE